MAQDTDKLMLEILKRLQADMADLKEAQHTTNRHPAAIESHMAGFHATTSAHSDDLAGLKERVARIERRLDITD